jgi:uncharacterized protein (UPF0264 family)
MKYQLSDRRSGSLGLLVSVRSAGEAQAAMEGGADVIDVKQPERGPLGQADLATINEVLQIVAHHRPVTAAMGELLNEPEARITQASRLTGLSVLKIGLAGAIGTDWLTKLASLANLCAGCRLAPAIYADYRAASAPQPLEVIEQTAQIGCSWVVIDTWDKQSGDLFDHASMDDLRSFSAAAQANGIQLVLAGSLRGEAIEAAARLKPALIGVRGAVCCDGRLGKVDAELVAASRARLRSSPYDATIGNNQRLTFTPNTGSHRA